ncbi:MULTISPECIES: hypothetical protein [unclassified Microcoleus]|uniref:hypothetical protein n=1 Tax=unclassified Microcoleus TaxID=2642155 RepID=UPI002FD2A8E6
MGKIRSKFPFNRAKLAAYPGVLATYNVAAGDVTGLKNAIASANSIAVDDFIELTSGTYTLTTRIVKSCGAKRVRKAKE